MKTYLITGGNGFIGSHVIDEILKLSENDIIIVNIDKLGIGSNVNNVVNDSRIINYYNDICDDIIFDIYEKHKPDYIIHCAAESHVDRSISNPIDFINSNVKGTANILEAMRKYVPNARMVHVSTDEVYGHLSISEPPFIESTLIDPRSPYSASKAGSDMLAFSYRSTYNLDITVTRCCNNYGPRQHSEKLIPTVIRSIISGEKIPVYGNGLNIREWIFVTDHAKALLEVLHLKQSQRVYNIYGTKTISNIELISVIITKVEEKYEKYKRPELTDYITFVADRQGHDFRYAMSTVYSDITSLNKQISFEYGISQTLEYYCQ